MGKVLVDRELLSRAADVLGSQSFSAWDEIAEQLRAFIAQPAEAEGVQRYCFDQTGCDVADNEGPWVSYDDHLAALSAVTAERGAAAFNAVISYMLGEGRWEEPMEFLRLWNEGDFDALRAEWPEAPIAIYYADPLADHEAIDAAMTMKGEV